MALDLAEAAGILKEVYLPVVREQLNNKVMLLTQINKNTEDVEGEEAVLSLHVSRNSGVGARAEGGTLPTAGNQEYTKQRVPLRTQTGRFQVTVQAIEAMRTNRGAWERAVDSEMKRLTNDAKRDVNRQLFGTSNGTIATTANGASSTTVELATTTTATQLRQLYVGQRIDISAAATPGNAAVASARVIESIDSSALTFVVSGAAVDAAAGDRIEVSGSGGSGASQKELTGLQTIIDSTGTLFDVNPTTYPVWASYEDVPGADRTPTESVFEEAMDEAEIASGQEINLWITTHGVRRAYAAQLTSLKRFTNTNELKGGFKGLDVTAGGRTATMVVDRDCPTKTAFGINTDHLQKHEQTDWDFMDQDGAILSRVANQLAYEGTLYSIFELTTDQRNAHAKVGALTEA